LKLEKRALNEEREVIRFRWGRLRILYRTGFLF
jgi:hypothetical protein